MGRLGSGTTTGSARFGSAGRAPPGSCSSLASRLSRLSPGTSETSRTRTSRTSRSIRSASRYRAIAGGPPQGPPTAQHFWAVSASGVGQQTVTWEVREGDWSVVLMNADGSRRGRRRRRPRGQAVIPALARGRAAPRWWVCPRWEHRADRPRRAQASGAAHAAGACLREQRGK